MSALFPEHSVWTVEHLAELPREGRRLELLHGELLLTPAPEYDHQRIAAELCALLMRADSTASPVSIVSPGAVQVSRTTYFEPDIAVYGLPRAQRPASTEMSRPLLVIEVLSPSTRSADRHRKRPEYLRHGIAQVWTVDPEARVIERWSAASEFPMVERDDFEVRLTSSHADVWVSLSAVFGTAQAPVPSGAQ